MQNVKNVYFVFLNGSIIQRKTKMQYFIKLHLMKMKIFKHQIYLEKNQFLRIYQKLIIDTLEITEQKKI